MPIGQLPAEERQRLAEQWGYKTIGAELPDGVTLTEIVKTMPPEVSGDGRAVIWQEYAPRRGHEDMECFWGFGDACVRT